MGLILYNTMVLLNILNISWFGKAFKLCLACSHPKNNSFGVISMQEKTTAEIFFLLKGFPTRQLCTSLVDSQKIW